MIASKFYTLPEDRTGFFKAYKAAGFDTAFVGPDVWNDTEFCKNLIKEGLDVFLIFPVFYEPKEYIHPEDYGLTENGEPAKEEWVSFACPSNVEFLKKRINTLSRITREIQPTGVSIDFIRYFVFWEKVSDTTLNRYMVDSCFCSSCLNDFASRYSLEEDFLALANAKEAACKIHEEYQDQWTEYKTVRITEVFKALGDAAKNEKPDVLRSFHAVPWFRNEWDSAVLSIAGQDLKRVGPCADIISPMCYTQMLQKRASWITELCSEFKTNAHKPVIPAIQVGKCYADNDFPVNEFMECVESAYRAGEGSVLLWSWEYLVKEPEKLNAFSSWANGEKG